MLPRLTDTGEVVQIKSGKKANGKPYAEERKLIETYYEYYIENIEEIKSFINMIALNADSFDYKQYLESADNAPVETSSVLTTDV